MQATQFIHPVQANQTGSVPCGEIAEASVEFPIPATTDPFMDMAVDAVVTAPDGKQMTLPCFWAGGSVFKFRYAVSAPGTHTYSFRAAEGSVSVPEAAGRFEGRAAESTLELLQKGAPAISANDKYLIHCGDQSPFFWLADSWWFGMSKRINLEEFELLTRDRAEKGFSVIQFAIGFACDIEPYDPRDMNEAGFIWEEDFATINPAYFEHTDQRIATLIAHGLVPNIVGMWGYYLSHIGRAKAKRHWRYLIARYGALPVNWTLCGEVRLTSYTEKDPEKRHALVEEQRAGWAEVGSYIKQADPWERLLTCHVGPKPGGKNVDPLTDLSVLDFHFIQPGHSDFDALGQTLSDHAHALANWPTALIMVGECCFEGMHGAAGPKIQRNLFWGSICSGMPGYSYGVDALWQMNRRGDPFGPSVLGHAWGNEPWEEAYQWLGSKHLGLGAKIVKELPWWDFEPHPEWVDKHATADDTTKAFACGIPGKMRLIYMPKIIAPWGGRPTVCNLEPEVSYEATFVSPIDGERFPLGRIEADPTGSWPVPAGPILHDWVLLLEAK